MSLIDFWPKNLYEYFFFFHHHIFVKLHHVRYQRRQKYHNRLDAEADMRIQLLSIKPNFKILYSTCKKSGVIVHIKIDKYNILII